MILNFHQITFKNNHRNGIQTDIGELINLENMVPNTKYTVTYGSVLAGESAALETLIFSKALKFQKSRPEFHDFCLLF